MTTNTIAPNRGSKFIPTALPLDDTRGIWAMWMVVATEAALFVCLFGAYFYLENNKDRWTYNTPPAEHWGWGMLGALIVSGFTIWLGDRAVIRQAYLRARALLACTLLLGLGFLIMEGFDYASHWATLTPYSNSYGSIFYTIESFDALHVIVGVLILGYVLAMPRYAPARRAPYRPYRVAAIYWYFVVIVWIAIFFLLYVMPNLRIYGF